MGIRDVYFTDRYRTTLTGTAASLISNFNFGTVQKPCRTARLTTLVYDPNAGEWLGDGASYRLLSGVDFMLMISGVPVFSCQGHPGHSYGVPFTLDVRGGETIGIMMDNTNPLSELDGEIVTVQVFLDYEPEYQIEENRKGNPIPSI